MILVRHAESEWNRALRAHPDRSGHPRSAADRAGRAQAERLIDTLAAAGRARG